MKGTQWGPDYCPKTEELDGSIIDPTGPTYDSPILETAVLPMVLVLVPGMWDFSLFENRIYYVLGGQQRGLDGCPQEGELVCSSKDIGGPTYVGPILVTTVPPMV